MRRYKSRQLLPFSGRIVIKIRITDHNGNWSFQTGQSFQGNMSRSFRIGLNEAILNALYKHFYRFDRPIMKSEDVSLTDFIKSYDLKDWYILYITEQNRYSFKTVNRKLGRSKTKHRYLEIKYKGKHYSRTRFEPQSKQKVDKIIQELV